MARTTSRRIRLPGKKSACRGRASHLLHHHCRGMVPSVLWRGAEESVQDVCGQVSRAKLIPTSITTDTNLLFAHRLERSRSLAFRFNWLRELLMFEKRHRPKLYLARIIRLELLPPHIAGEDRRFERVALLVSWPPCSLACLLVRLLACLFGAGAQLKSTYFVLSPGGGGRLGGSGRIPPAFGGKKCK